MYVCKVGSFLLPPFETLLHIECIQYDCVFTLLHIECTYTVYMCVLFYSHMCVCVFSTEAVVVRGLFTLTSVSYHSSFDRQGSTELTQITSHIAHQVHTHMIQCLTTSRDY